MSNYTKSTNFATKDNLSPGDPLKIVRGTEIDTEFNNISTAISTKTDNSAAAITGGSITGITDLAIADGGTGASTATAALNNLLPSQTGNGTKYLQTDGSNATWDPISLSTSDITGTLPVANGGTGVTSSTGTGSVVLSNSPTLVTPALGTPASGVATNLTGLPISTGVSGLGTGVATFLATPSSSNLASAVSDETGSGALVFANSPTLVTPALGTPSALVGTNITGTASGLTAGNVTTNANLTGAVTSSGNATSLGSFTSAQLLGALTDETGTGSAVFATSPTLVTPILGTPQSGNFSTGTFTWPTFNQNTTGTAAGLSATLATTSGGTGLTSFTSGGVVYASSGSALATGSALTFDGTNLGVGTASPPVKFQVTNSATHSSASIQSADGFNATLFLGDVTDYSHAYIRYLNDVNQMAFAINGASEGMRLTSTGLGIGTSSPTTKLDVNSSAASVMRLTRNGGTAANTALQYFNGSVSWYEGMSENGLYCISYNSAVLDSGQLRLDSAGNLGLGVTPSAWSANFKVLDVAGGSGGGAFYSATNVPYAGLGTNYYENAGSKYKVASQPATNYLQYNGVHSWYTTGTTTGTAGSAISFTQAMSLTADGNLLLGTTTNNGRLSIQGSDASTTNAFYISNSTPAQVFRIQNNGYINTGTLASSPYNNTTASAANMFVDSGGGIGRSTSALKYKQNIRNLESIDISKFRAVRYKSKCDGDDQTKDHFGFIADEVDAAGIKELVSYGANNEIEGFQYDRMTAVLLKAIQEQQALIQSLKARLDAANL